MQGLGFTRTLKVCRRIAFLWVLGPFFHLLWGGFRSGLGIGGLISGAEARTLGQYRGLRVISSGFCAKLGLDFDSNSHDRFQVMVDRSVPFRQAWRSLKLRCHHDQTVWLGCSVGNHSRTWRLRYSRVFY